MNANDYYNKYIEQGEYDKYMDEAITKAATKNNDKIVTICKLCGAKYKERPTLCLCKSNVFLINIKE